MTDQPSRCPLCTQRVVRGTVCRACGYTPRPSHPLHPEPEPQEQVTHATESDTNAPHTTQRTPEGHGPYDDDWIDLGSGG